MAAQYDVNLEKCALLKCMCGEWKLNSALAAGQAPFQGQGFFICHIISYTGYN